MRIVQPFLAAFALLSNVAIAGDRIAMLPFSAGPGITPAEAALVGERFANTIGGQGAFEVLDNPTRDGLLKEKAIEIPACTASVCRKEMGKVLGVDGMLTGSVSRNEEEFSFEVQMIATKTGRNLRKMSQTLGPGILEDLAADAAKKAATEFATIKFPGKP